MYKSEYNEVLKIFSNLIKFKIKLPDNFIYCLLLVSNYVAKADDW